MGTYVGDTVGARVGELLGMGVGTEIVLVKVTVVDVDATAAELNVTDVLEVTAVTVVPDDILEADTTAPT